MDPDGTGLSVPRHPVLKVFIASPGDVGAERKAAERAIGWVSDHVAKPLGWRVEPLMWERDVLPGTGKDAQSVINAQIGEMRQVALFLLIMRGKFGTPTPRAGSGTEEEYDRAIAARKRLREPKRPELSLWFGEPRSDSDLKQLAKVRAFKAQVGKTVMYTSFKTVPDFERQFREFLTKWITRELARLIKPAAPSRAALTAQYALLLEDRIYRGVHQSEGDARMTVKLSSLAPDDEKVLRDLRHKTVSYGYRLKGGTAHVSDVQFERNDKGVKATLQLTFGQRGGSSSYAQLDEESRKHIARRILLGEAARSQDSVHRFFTPDDTTSVVPPILARSDDVASRAEARVRAVHALLAAGVVTEINKLTLSAPTPQGVKVAFSGTYSSWGSPAQTLQIEGFVKSKTRARANPQARANNPARKRPTRRKT